MGTKTAPATVRHCRQLDELSEALTALWAALEDGEPAVHIAALRATAARRLAAAVLSGEALAATVDVIRASLHDMTLGDHVQDLVRRGARAERRFLDHRVRATGQRRGAAIGPPPGFEERRAA